ncbi:MAG: DUF6115 domain-containing protein [Firmicutes bacterium]|nr:DUF6115 domain-containing protein [Bacillota bacterium]
MEITEIVLLAAGGIIFILSFLLPDKKGEASEQSRELVKDEIADMVSREMDSVRGQVDGVVEEAVTYAMEKTERSLERLSNEKIMAVNEYSDTVLAEIHKNHEEAMFLYDMLNSKHDNLKNTVSTVNRTVKEVEEKLGTIRELQADMSGMYQAGMPEGRTEVPGGFRPVRLQELHPAEPVSTGPTAISRLQSMTQRSAASMPAASMSATSLSQTSMPATSLSQTSMPATSLSQTSMSATSMSATSIPAASMPATSMSATSMPATSMPQTSMSRAAVSDRGAGMAGSGNGVSGTSPAEIADPRMVMAPVVPVPAASMPAASVPAASVPAASMPRVPASGDISMERDIFMERGSSMEKDISMGTMGRVSFLQENAADGQNNNERILELHRQGKSKVAIAKELGLGVGEVKLVIDLFRNQ